MKAANAMREIAKVAETQDGLVTTSQAVRSGVPRLNLARLAESGDLDRLAHGVYRVRGADEDEYTNLRAAWLAVDPGRTAAERAADLDHPIVVSHRSAAAVHGIGNLYADRHEMTAPVRKQSRRSEVLIHRAAVPRSDITVARGMLVTTVERTLADLARTEPELGDVADALADAYLRNAVDLEALAPKLDAAARRHGSRDGAELLGHMLELKGLDATSAIAELAQRPELRRLLAEASHRHTASSQVLRDMLASSYVAEIEQARREALEAVHASSVPLISTAVPNVTVAMAGIDVIARDLGRYNELARLARQVRAGLPPGVVRKVTRDE